MMIFKQGNNVTFLNWFSVYKELSNTLIWILHQPIRGVLTPFYGLRNGWLETLDDRDERKDSNLSSDVPSTSLRVVGTTLLLDWLAGGWTDELTG